MKKIVAVVAFALALLGGAAAAQAASVTECHSVFITVNGESVVGEAACNTLPPQ